MSTLNDSLIAMLKEDSKTGMYRVWAFIFIMQVALLIYQAIHPEHTVPAWQHQATQTLLVFLLGLSILQNKRHSDQVNSFIERIGQSEANTRTDQN